MCASNRECRSNEFGWFQEKKSKTSTRKLDGMVVYHYIQDRNLQPDFVVDITPYIEKKIELVLSFRSQFFLPTAGEFAKELSTPISGADFLEFLKAKGRSLGRDANFDYAEGYNVARTPGVKNLFDLI
jgi:hypothetical protein